MERGILLSISFGKMRSSCHPISRDSNTVRFSYTPDVGKGEEVEDNIVCVYGGRGRWCMCVVETL